MCCQLVTDGPGIGRTVPILAALTLLGGGCLESSTVQCPWGLYCPADQICHEGLRRCVRSIQLRVCEQLAPGDRCEFPGSGSLHKCRRGACEEPVCGDSIVDEATGEECDDGNSRDHDGCSRDCHDEVLRWHKLELESGVAQPEPRSKSAAAYDPQQQRQVVFGGEGEGGLLDDTWTLQLSGLNAWPPQGAWRRVADASAKRPAARSLHAMVFDTVRRRAVLFGGKVAGGTVMDDTWTFDGDRWAEVEASSRPLAVSQHQLAWDSQRGRVLLWGGLSQLYRQGLWSFDGRAWTKLPTVDEPATRRDHVMGYDAAVDLLVVTGGNNHLSSEDFQLESTWVFDGTAWRTLPATANLEPVLTSAACASAGRLVVFGGADETDQLLDETWVFKGYSERWLQQPKADLADVPPAREHHSMASLGPPGGVLLFGGQDATGKLLNDVWVGRFEPQRGCGNNQIDEGEGCDGPVFTHDLSCVALGYAGGALTCTATCAVDTSSCLPK